MKSPQGVRRINEYVLQEERALILTDTNKDNYSFADLPDGTTYIDTTTGNEYVKLKGQSDWVAKNVKQDNTICIMKDSMVVNEMFTVTEINKDDMTFVYLNTEGEQRTSYLTDEGYCVFKLDKGTYLPGRHHLQAMIDGVLQRDTASETLVEVDPNRFYTKDELEVGHKIFVTYVEWIRIGNPYPRVFMMDDEPEESEIGDLWIDTNATLDDEGNVSEGVLDRGKVNWNDVYNTPTTIDGYGITDAAYKNHKHTVSDITDFPDSLPADGGDADSVGGHYPGTSAGNVLVIGEDGKIPSDLIDTSFITGTAFTKGMIIDWYGQSNSVPDGWHICDGTNGTPDLRDKFIICAGNNYNLGSTGGAETVTLTTNQIPSHTHSISSAGGHTHKSVSGLADDAIWDATNGGDGKQYGRSASIAYGDNIGYEGGHPISAVTSSAGSHTHTIGSVGSGQSHNNMPPYYALFKIMKT